MLPLHHIGNGMYGAIVIDPPDLANVDHEYLLVQSELYLGPQGQPGWLRKPKTESFDAVVFNGLYPIVTHKFANVAKAPWGCSRPATSRAPPAATRSEQPPEDYASSRSVLRKSLPRHSSGSPASLATAYVMQSPTFRPAG